MVLEQIINQKLNKYPSVKKRIKRIYQRTMYTVSPKVKSEGNIIRVTPNDSNHEYFFGYYDKSPWDITDRYLLCLRAKDTWSDVSPKEKADILMIDTEKDENDVERVKKIGETHAWNVQQGCMLQWLGPDYNSKIIYNDFRGGKYCSVILTISTMEEKIISMPIYSVSEDGSFALTLDFSRLYELRPGYGYYNVKEKTKGIALPNTTAIWKVNLENGEVYELLKYTDFANYKPRKEMQEKNTIHKVNHIMLSPNSKRFMVLYRWFNGERKYTRLITCNVDGSDMYILSDDDMVSHCYWKNNNEILAFENKEKTGIGYYLMQDKTQQYIQCWSQLSGDGHPSYSPNRKLVVTDTYPDRARVARIYIMSGDEKKKQIKTVAKVFAPFKYDNDTRCDLHPRWSRKGDKICFDSVFEGHRGIYTVSINDKQDNSVNKKDYKLSVIVPVYNVEKYLKRCVNSITKQSYKNLEIILVDDGSTDKSGAICDELSQGDKRIKVIHKSNGGLSSARNAGLDIVTGELLTFVDSDDWIEKEIYKKCINIFIKNKCDIVDYGVAYVSKENEEIKQPNGQMKIIYGEDILYDYLYKGQTEKCPFSVCRKVYCRDCYKNLRFPEGKVNEDIVTNFKVLEKCKCLVHIADIGYYYFQGRETSITSGKLKKKDFDLLNAAEELCELSKAHNNNKLVELADTKLARSYFSLLSKAAIGGTSNDISEQNIRNLILKLRKNYVLLMKSPMPINRKILVTTYCINYNFSLKIIKIIRKIKKKW